MKSILALTALLAASAANLAFVHDASAETFVMFTHAANGSEKVLARTPNLGKAACERMAAAIWKAAHKADVAALDADCVPDHARAGQLDAGKPQPRLIGYGCNGATAPLYGNAEDEFPACRSISPYTPKPAPAASPVVVILLAK